MASFFEMPLRLLQGFGINVLITVLATFFPLVLGVILTVLAGKVRYVGRIAEWVSLPFECITPIVFIVVMYYCPFLMIDLFDVLGPGEGFVEFLRDITRSSWFIGIMLSFAFVGYMPARYNPSASILKNILCNGCGLVCTAFQWSFAVGFVGVLDMLKMAMLEMSRLFDAFPFVLVALVALIVVGALQIAKRLCSQFLK